MATESMPCGVLPCDRGIAPYSPEPIPFLDTLKAVPVKRNSNLHALCQRLIEACEPWYNWGRVNVERMDQIDADGFGGEGEVRFFDLQWFGIHIGLQFGRTPKAVRS